MSGLMSHTIKVYRPTTTVDAIGGQVVSLALLSTIRGRIPGGSPTTNEQGSIKQTNQITAMLPVVDIKIKDFLYWNNQWYQINSITYRVNHHIEADISLTNPPLNYGTVT